MKTRGKLCIKPLNKLHIVYIMGEEAKKGAAA